MAQDFTCFCNTATCKQIIMGAKHMTNEQLKGMYLNAHIRELLEARNKDRSVSIDGIKGLEEVANKLGGYNPEGHKLKPVSVKKVVAVNGVNDADGSGGAVSKGSEENGDKTKPASVEKGANDSGAAGGAVGNDATLEALKASLEQAKMMVESAQKALDIYQSIHGDGSTTSGGGGGSNGAVVNGAGRSGVGDRALAERGGDTRHGVTSREMSGEMGGDTASTVVQVFAGGIVNVGV
jgi:hypothetical protein